MAADPAPLAAPAAPAAAATKLPVAPWLRLTPLQRQKILQAWLQLPDSTRPPFPIYRDNALAQMSAPPAATEK